MLYNFEKKRAAKRIITEAKEFKRINK